MSNSAKQFKPIKVVITSVDGSEYDVTRAVGMFSYYEDIYQPFITGNMLMIDSGQNFIGNLPIQGGEKVVVKLNNVKGDEVEYEMHIDKVVNRSIERNMQYYTLVLTSKEGIENNSARVTEKYKANPEAIVQDILRNILKTKKEIYTEESQFKMSIFPNGKKCHALVQSLMYKTVAKSTKFQKGGDKGGTTSESELGGNNKKSASGTAGYLFFENKDGFVFQSMDRLCSDGTDSFGGRAPVATYYSRPSAGMQPDQVFYNIENYVFDDEIDMGDKLNNGIFSTHMCYFDISSQKYEEYTYDMSKTFNNMSHLGSQTSLGKFQKDMAKKPSRVMSILLDHEAWYTGEDVANPDEGGDAQFPDYAKYYTSQSIGRRYLMETHKVQIEICGNSDLKVGDKIKIMLPNMVAEKLREEQPYDEETSGTYLISALSHNYAFVRENGSPEFFTNLELIRDTMGIKEYDSKVK